MPDQLIENRDEENEVNVSPVSPPMVEYSSSSSNYSTTFSPKTVYTVYKRTCNGRKVNIRDSDVADTSSLKP